MVNSSQSNFKTDRTNGNEISFSVSLGSSYASYGGYGYSEFYGEEILCAFFSGSFSKKTVTLDSIEIFTSHEWLKREPTIYFHCQDEDKTVFPDVKKINVVYRFKGMESWQPLTDLSGDKCKRCGLYEKDNLKSDDVFDEWELCPDDFVGSDGKYIHFKEKEFNATFSCPECKKGLVHAKLKDASDGKGVNIVVAILVSILVSAVTVTALVFGYKYWQKKKREKDQARFLKLFEEGDDIEDELGLGV